MTIRRLSECATIFGLERKVDELVDAANYQMDVVEQHERRLTRIESTCAAHKWANKAEYGVCRDEIAIVKCCATCNNSPIRGGACSSSGIVRGCTTGKWERIKPARMLPGDMKPFDLGFEIQAVYNDFGLCMELSFNDRAVIEKFLNFVQEWIGEEGLRKNLFKSVSEGTPA
jgi:hypothetical protein